MRFWDKVLRLLSRLFRVVNNSSSMSLSILIGSPISVYLFLDLLNSPTVEHHFLLTIIIVLLPFMLYKMLLYFLLACFDFILIATTDFNRSYDVDIEKVRARVTKVMLERKVAFQSLETIALGLERELLLNVRQILHLKYPLIYVATDKPFVVIKIFRAINSTKVQRLMKQLENKERVGVRIFAEESNEAKVLSKIIINSLEFLNKENDSDSQESNLEETK